MNQLEKPTPPERLMLANNLIHFFADETDKRFAMDNHEAARIFRLAADACEGSEISLFPCPHAAQPDHASTVGGSAEEMQSA